MKDPHTAPRVGPIAPARSEGWPGGNWAAVPPEHRENANAWTLGHQLAAAGINAVDDPTGEYGIVNNPAALAAFQAGLTAGSANR